MFSVLLAVALVAAVPASAADHGHEAERAGGHEHDRSHRHGHDHSGATTSSGASATKASARGVVAHGAGAPLPTATTWPLSPLAPPGRRLATLRGYQRTRWCDLAAQAMKMQPLPFEYDAVFRQIPPHERARLDAALASVDAAPDDPAAKATLRGLLRGPGGPALCRLAFHHRSVPTLREVVDAARVHAADHPRLAGFVNGLAGHPDVELASLTVAFLLESGCDTPALFAFVGAEHADARVRAATIDAYVRAATLHDESGQYGRLLERVTQGKEPDAAVRARILRGALYLGMPDAEEAARTALSDRDANVAAEALVVIAYVRGEVDPPRLRKALAAKAAVTRAGAVRAALLLATPTALAEVAKVTDDRGAYRDPVTGELVAVGELARAGLRALGVAAAPAR